MIPLLLLLPLLFLLAVYGKDSKKEESRVVVIAIDGLRWQEVFEGARRDSLMPFLWEMGRKKGCMIGNRNRKSKMEVANGIWKSYAGYSEMLCGVTDDEHIFDNAILSHFDEDEFADGSGTDRQTGRSRPGWCGDSSDHQGNLLPGA